MSRPTAAADFIVSLHLVVAAATLAGCGGGGTVLLDICTPPGAADPLAGAAELHVTSEGDSIHQSIFPLGSETSFVDPLAYPVGDRLRLIVESRDGGGNVLGAARSEEFTVQQETEICVCLTTTADSGQCANRGCRFLPATSECRFFETPAP